LLLVLVVRQELQTGNLVLTEESHNSSADLTSLFRQEVAQVLLPLPVRLLGARVVMVLMWVQGHLVARLVAVMAEMVVQQTRWLTVAVVVLVDILVTVAPA
jgi:formate/nitrite transporter FocA (FNT family)